MIDQLEFEVFNRRATLEKTPPLVTLQPRGTLALNQAAKDALGDPQHVELLFDRKQQVIGIRAAADPDSSSSYPLKEKANGRVYITGEPEFFEYYHIQTGRARRFEGKMVDDVLTIDLKGRSTSVIH